MTTRNRPWTIPAAGAAVPGVLAGTAPDDFGLLVATAAAAAGLIAVFDTLTKRDPHEALVRRIEQQMKGRRRAARARKRVAADRIKSGRT